MNTGRQRELAGATALKLEGNFACSQSQKEPEVSLSEQGRDLGCGTRWREAESGKQICHPKDVRCVPRRYEELW